MTIFLTQLVIRKTNSENYRYRHTLFSSVQSLSHVRLFATPWTAVRQASLSTTNSWSLLKLMSTESVIPSKTILSSIVPFTSCLQSFPATNDIDYLLFSRSVMSDSLRPHGLQHARFLCPPLSPGACSNSCPLNQ